MTCPICERWVARNWDQWDIRQANMRDFPHVSTYTCENCGGTDWATRQPEMSRPQPWYAVLWNKFNDWADNWSRRKK